MTDLGFGSVAPFAEPLWYSRGASQYYGPSHRRLRAFVRRYVDEELRPFAHDWEESGEIPARVSVSCPPSECQPGAADCG